MNTEKNESLIFANEDTIFRIIAIAKGVAWAILVIYLIIFVDQVRPLFQQPGSFPRQFSQWLPMVANLLYIPAIGLFYFLVLQAVAQGLNLGLDIFYELHPEEDDSDEQELIEEEV